MEYIIWILIFLLGIEIGVGIYGYKNFLKEKEKDKHIPIEPPASQVIKPKEKKYDVVYILRNDINDNTKELRYSLRSLENFKYKNVWFAGGQPIDLIPDKAFPIIQEGKNKMEKVIYTLKQICLNDEISEDFWIFNDDFFVMKPHEQCAVYSNGTIESLIGTIKKERRSSKYVRILEVTIKLLKQNHLPTKNYALHAPMLINKQKALKVLEEFPHATNFRNIYGNYYQLESTEIKDMKYFDNSRPINEDAIFLSTWEKSFSSGLVGQYIRKQFPNPSRFEK